MGAQRPTELGGQQREQADRTKTPKIGSGFGARSRGDCRQAPAGSPAPHPLDRRTGGQKGGERLEHRFFTILAVLDALLHLLMILSQTR